MAWDVEFEDAFEAEFRELDPEVQDSLLAVAKLLVDYGPQLGRPTLTLSRDRSTQT
jgi:hypothetical protein